MMAVWDAVSYTHLDVYKRQVLYRGQDLAQFDRKQMAGFRGKCCSIIFQDPMTSLNPVFTVGSQIMEAIRLHKMCIRDRGYADHWRDMALCRGFP